MKQKIKITFALCEHGVRMYPNSGRDVEMAKNASAFKKAVKNFLTRLERYKKGRHVSIGRWDPMGEEIKDWHNLSKLPANFLETYGYYDYCLSTTLK